MCHIACTHSVFQTPNRPSYACTNKTLMPQEAPASVIILFFVHRAYICIIMCHAGCQREPIHCNDGRGCSQRGTRSIQQEGDMECIERNGGPGHHTERRNVHKLDQGLRQGAEDHTCMITTLCIIRYTHTPSPVCPRLRFFTRSVACTRKT
jgi:hypothetical protein